MFLYPEELLPMETDTVQLQYIYEYNLIFKLA
jgi:hypothetical protein